MVKATLRKPKSPAPAAVAEKPAIDVEAKVVSTETAPAGAEDLEALAGGEAPESPEETTTAVATRPTGAVTAGHRNTSFDGVEGLEGDFTDDDVKFPQLKQVQGSGPLSTQFDNGTIILGETELLPAPSVKEGAKNTPLVIVPVAIKKQYREKLGQEEVDAGSMPRIFDSLDEVAEAGLTTRWIGNSMPDNFAEDSSRSIFLIQQPEGSDHPGFNMELDGKLYAVAVYYAAGGAYRDFIKHVVNASKTSLVVPVIENGQPKKNDKGVVVKKSMLYKCFWSLTFAKKKAGNFTPWRPSGKIIPGDKGITGPELRAYVDNLLNSGKVESKIADE